MEPAPTAEPRVLARAEHPISRDNIDPNALKVLYRLHNAGQKAYLVGGSVRDLMLGRRPKDFDVGTDARPPEIRRLFRNSRIIGRRFRLAHVYFREGVVEVSTFRRDPDPEAQESAPGDLLITDDNVFGTPRQDAFRRDFTVNALFYDIADFSVIDFVGGVEDLERRLIRSIGDPDVRFQEDPVRMTRACELAGRLGFAIERGSQESITRHRRLLAKASAARITDELLQLLRCGHAGQALQWMLDLGVVEVLLPELDAMVAAEQRGIGSLGRILPALDRIVAGGGEVSDTGLFAALLLPHVLVRRYDLEASRSSPLSRSGLERLVSEAVAPFASRFTLSGQRAEGVARAICAFHRLTESGGSPSDRVAFARRPCFPDALFLFELMVEATGEGRVQLRQWKSALRRRPEGGDEGRGTVDERARRRRPRRGRRGGRSPRRRES